MTIRRILGNIWPTLFLFLFALSILWRGGKGIEATWLLGGVVTIQVLLSSAAHKKSGRVLSQNLWLMLMISVAWFIVSFAFSSTRNYGLDELVRFVSLSLFFIWVAAHGKDDGGSLSPFVRRILQDVFFVTLIAAAFGMAVYVLQPVNRFVGSFFYFRSGPDYWPNAWAEYVLLVWPLFFSWAQKASSKIAATLRFGIVGWLLGCLLLSYSRASVIVLALQILLLALVYRKEIAARWKAMLAPTGVLLVIVILTFGGLNLLRSQFYEVESVVRKATFTAAEGTSSFTERLEFYEQSVILSMEHPLLGWGPYSFRFIQPRLQSDVLATSDHPHDVFLKFALEEGWPEAVIIFCMLLMVLVPAAKRLWKEESIRRGSFGLEAAMFTGVLGVLAHNLIDYNLQFVGIALPFTLFLSLLAPSIPSIPQSIRLVRRRTGITLSAMLLILLVIECHAQSAAFVGRILDERKQPQSALQWDARAQWTLFPRDLKLSEALQFIHLNLLSDARNALRQYIDINPEDARGWQMLGNIDMQLFRFDDAAKAYKEAFVLNRMNDFGITRDYLASLAQGGNTSDIAKNEAEILNVFDAFERAVEENAHYVTLSHNIEDFQAAVPIARALFPKIAGHLTALLDAVTATAKDVRQRSRLHQNGYLW